LCFHKTADPLSFTDMKRRSFLILGGTLPWALVGEDDVTGLDALVKQGEKWAQENLDEKLIESLQQLDSRGLEKLLLQFQKEFESNYVLDLSSARETAHAVVPLIEQVPNLQPYASWLRTRLDYFDVADELQKLSPVPPPVPNKPAPRRPNPSSGLQLRVWERRMALRSPVSAGESYANRLKPIFLAQGVPAELVWLAEVESSFDPNARSPAGARGLFQLMPATAKRQGLQLSPMDERLNPEKSAKAAASLLKILHHDFGDWRLALAAYNAGDGRVHGLIGKQRPMSFDAIATRLPAETQLYVPKVEATVKRRTGRSLGELQIPRF
jgi:membrane-bound lytic murein transglycosylase D